MKRRADALGYSPGIALLILGLVQFAIGRALRRPKAAR